MTGVRLAAVEAGDPSRPSVVLVHAAGTSGWMWKQQMELLSSRFHVLVPDLPGHGHSADVRWESITRTAELVAEVIDARASYGRAHVVGLSLGGYVTLQLAATAPNQVLSALASGVTVLPFPHPLAMRMLGAVMGPFIHLSPVIRMNATSLRVPPEEFDGYRDAVRMMTRQAFLAVNTDAMNFRTPAGASTSPTPVLAVAGHREHQLVLRSLPEIANAFPHGSARVVAQAGHAWSAELPTLFGRTVSNWISGEPLPPELESVEAPYPAPLRR